MNYKKVNQFNKIRIIMEKRMKIIIKNNQINRIIKNRNKYKQIIIHYKTKEITLMNLTTKRVMNKKMKKIVNNKMNLL